VFAVTTKPMIAGSADFLRFAESANRLSLARQLECWEAVMIGKHAWVSHDASRWSLLDLRRRDWIGVLWDPVLYIIAALLCAILAIDAFVLLHTL